MGASVMKQQRLQEPARWWAGWATMMRWNNLHFRRMAILLATIVPGGCGQGASPPSEVRPEWRGAAVDGLAPLMTPEAVAAALSRHGYRQVSCGRDRRLSADPLRHGRDIPCYRSASRPMMVNLFFLDLVEGRRLAVVNFRADYDADVDDAQRLADSRKFAARVKARFGAPFVTSGGPGFKTFYWKRPGGLADLPDMLSTTVGAQFPPNVTMTSMWAYGKERPQ